MIIELDPSLDAFVADLVARGIFPSEKEAVRGGLMLLKAQQEEYQKRLEELRRKLDVGIAAANRGETRVFDESVVQEVIARGMAKLAPRAGSQQ